mmetsp:Transcript_72468/g.172752  ORF Transcript_72468/g.172752 Transcript_72468/m.172752 type:complete len:532 (-) Transcript_72468:108-1703(-)
MVLCCICGVEINGPSEGGRCAQCLRREVDIGEGISRHHNLERCGTCSKYLKPPWVHCEPESRELLGVCLKHIKGISREHKLVDANFIYTEPHSKELKVKLLLQKEAMAGVVVQQAVVVDFRVNNLQCGDCKKSFTKHTWESCVQVRQRVDHRRSLLHLEQMILQHKAHQRLIGLEHKKDGLDFFFSRHRDCEAFVAFVKAWSVAKVSESKQLISHNAANSTYRFKRTALLELCPVCRDDLVFLPPKTAQALGGLPPVMLCTRAVSFVRLVDPATLRCVEVSSTDYWKRPFQPLLSKSQLQEFIVLDVSIEAAAVPAGSHSGRSPKLVACEVEVARVADFGLNDERVTVSSHLGAVLKPGDTVLGFDLRTVNTAVDDEQLADVPLEVYLVRLPKKSNRSTDSKAFPDGGSKASGSNRSKKTQGRQGKTTKNSRQGAASKNNEEAAETAAQNPDYYPDQRNDSEDDMDEDEQADQEEMTAAAQAWLGSLDNVSVELDTPQNGPVDAEDLDEQSAAQGLLPAAVDAAELPPTDT